MNNVIAYLERQYGNCEYLNVNMCTINKYSYKQFGDQLEDPQRVNGQSVWSVI